MIDTQNYPCIYVLQITYTMLCCSVIAISAWLCCVFVVYQCACRDTQPLPQPLPATAAASRPHLPPPHTPHPHPLSDEGTPAMWGHLLDPKGVPTRQVLLYMYIITQKQFAHRYILFIICSVFLCNKMLLVIHICLYNYVCFI